MKLFPTTVVGSLPRPAFVRDLCARVDAASGSGLDDAHVALDKAVAFAIALTEGAGIDIVSDGEWRRLSYISVIADLVSGFKRDTRDGRSWHTVVRRMTPNNPGCVAAEARFLREHATREVKVALPSPYLLGERMWEEGASTSAYATRRDFSEALIPVLRAEIERIRDAGVSRIQLDDPHLCLLVDDRVRAQFADADAEALHCVDLINRVVRDIDGIETTVHLCRRNKGRDGWIGEGGYAPILPALSKLEVNGLLLEFTIPVAGELSVIAELPTRLRIGLGSIDCRLPAIETPDEIARRVEQATKYVAPERIFLHPDCGFAPGSTADIPLDEAYRKLEALARAATLLRG